jgi:hypothetical protein
MSRKIEITEEMAEALIRELERGAGPGPKHRIQELRAILDAPVIKRPVELAVWNGAMPESNGKSNFTIMLHRKDEHFSEGITYERSEYPDRIRYEADRLRYKIGELEVEPEIFDYDGDMHSGYKPAHGEQD